METKKTKSQPKAKKQQLNAKGGYDAGSRQKVVGGVPPPQIRSQDSHVNWQKQQMAASALDMSRNNANFRFIINKHLDYNTIFKFQCTSKDQNYADKVQGLMRWYSNSYNCDTTKRYDLWKLTRLVQQSALSFGDCFIVFGNDGRLQLVQGDRVANPPALNVNQKDKFFWVNGIKVSKKTGQELGYYIWNRSSSGGYSQGMQVKASECYHHGFFTRPDQYRGVSPVVTALNDFRNLTDIQSYSLLKARLQAMIGIHFKKSTAGMDPITGQPTEGGAVGVPRQINIANGMMTVQTEGQDDVTFMPGSTPSVQVQQFINQMIQNVLKCLDIPYCFYDQSNTNYTGSRSALQSYMTSCQHKRGSIQKFLDWVTFKRIELWQEDGLLPAVRPGWEWIAMGIPYWDSDKQGRGTATLIAMGLDNLQSAARQRGCDIYKNLEKTKAVVEYAKSLGLPLILNGVSGYNLVTDATTNASVPQPNIIQEKQNVEDSK